MLRFNLLLVTAALLSSTVPALAADDGKLTCEVLENGQAASGTLRVLDGEREVANGLCGKPLRVPAGKYTAVFGLDGALDGPEQRQTVSVEAGKSSTIRADFATGLLEIRIRSQGRDTAGMAVIRKGGQQVGTLGSGVQAHLSAGEYQVVARYRTQQKTFDKVVVVKGKSTVLEASFE